MNKLKEKILNPVFSKAEYIIIGAILTLCYVTFQHGDIAETAGHSMALLYGHILDFYNWNAINDMPASYPIATYIVFAIWCIPLRIIGLGATPTSDFPTYVLLYLKLLPTIIFFLDAFILRKIGETIGFGEQKSKALMIAFITMPLAVFSQFIFGQYDSFTLFFVLLGVYYYFKRDFWKFVIAFGVALPFKAFAILLFVPLLLTCEKRIGQIIKAVIVACIPYVLCALPFIGGAAYKQHAENYYVFDYIFAAKFDVTYWNISIVVLLMALLCGYAYFHEIDLDNQEEFAAWSIYYCGLALGAFFCFSIWNPQWLLLLVPFLLLGAFMSKHDAVFHALDLLMFVVFAIFVANQYGNVNEQLMRRGIWHDLFRQLGVVAQADLYVIHDNDLMFSLLSGIILIAVVFRHPKYRLEKYDGELGESMGWIRGKFYLGMAFYLIPMVICAIAAL